MSESREGIERVRKQSERKRDRETQREKEDSGRKEIKITCTSLPFLLPQWCPPAQPCVQLVANRAAPLVHCLTMH